ncbi:MAG: formyltetrahydrofolate deformylase [Thiomonas sp.]|uniref:formyltetrahydrofolate deformylase n=1 Tax=Thiomonas sp. TaxID=2047785 RepID=UPI002A370057|nr:formyltetrahydrofolate deformylase [Thiomonas sp.]MDY0331109.1 formyltetrahydrofolate deformylase [Thiomonas sp.]
MPHSKPEFVLTLSCPDAPGIVHSVSGLLYQAGCNIMDSQQYGDADTGLFFMRVHFSAPEHLQDAGQLALLFGDVCKRFDMQAQFHDLRVRPRVVIAVSQYGHCLNDLLYRWKAGQLAMDIAAVVSNHPTFADLTRSYGVDFHHLPLKAGETVETKRAQEQAIFAVMQHSGAELLVLARYMQILSAEFCAQLEGRAINIHHSFLPSFKGARPYAQAYARGVKLIGATAHYVTADLDEGPIIEQDVERVDHTMSAADLTAVGQDVESVVLARAVRWQVEHRILRNGHKTVVFR